MRKNCTKHPGKFPSAKRSELIAMVSAATNQSESSVRRALEMKKENDGEA